MMPALLLASALVQTASVPGWTFGGPWSRAYDAEVDRDTYRSGHASAMVRCPARMCPPFATLMQYLRADPFNARRIRLTAWIKATRGGKPRIWMRVDGRDGAILAFDNRDFWAKPGPFDWSRQQIVLEIAPDAAIIAFGLIQDGPGAAWIDDVTLEVVSNKVATTNRASVYAPTPRLTEAAIRERFESAKREPENLDFESRPAGQ